MAEEGKKISFGFSKSIKKTALQNVPPPEEKKIDYIDCLDGKSIKIVGGEEKKNEPLVIPMLGSKTWHDRVINKIDADIFEPKTTESDVIRSKQAVDIKIKKEPSSDIVNGDVHQNNNARHMEGTEIKKEPVNEVPLSLEAQAAREILSDLKSKENNKTKKIFAVPIKKENDDDLRGKEQSTLEDYENIPIDAFGEAMLRGMGWQPGKGVGKNEQVVAPVMPELRPKGMGLGADKATIQKALQKYSGQNDKPDTKIVKGGYVKITKGKGSGSYGRVEAFDDDSAKIYVKLALGDNTVAVNEFCVESVTSSEYMEKSKVLNLKSYEEYKQNEAKKEKASRKKDKVKREPSLSSGSSAENDQKSRRNEKSKKKSKKKYQQSSSDESSLDRKSRRKRNSSSSSEEGKFKKLKKSKKHKSRDSSSERSSRKNRKKDKEREKSRYKKSDYADSSERTRHRDRKRSRSRSRSKSPKSRRKNRSRSRSPRR